MARGFFVAVGIFVVLLGLECLVIDRVFLRDQAAPLPPQAANQQQSLATSFNSFRSSMMQQSQAPPQRQYQPPEWAPWSLLSVGVVTVLYAFALPKKISINA
jgi:hypothetical protein